MKSKCALYVLFPLLLIISCSKSDQTYTIEIKEGVKHIHNFAPAWGDTVKVALEFVRQIGQEESKDENYMFYGPSDIAKDADGNLYVVDAGNYRIQKFDPNGTYLATFGRKGQGPGEFTYNPWRINIDTAGNMYICDGNHIQIFGPGGKEIRRTKFAFRFNEFRLSRSSQLIISYGNPIIRTYDGKIKSEYEPKTSLVGQYNSEGYLVREFGKIHDFNNIYVTGPANTNFIEVDSHDNIYLAFYYQNRIEKYSPEGKLLWASERPLNFKLKYNLEETKSEMPDGEIRIYFSPRFTIVSSHIGVDYKGRIWVLTYMKNVREYRKSEEKFEIFNNDGVFLGRIPQPEKRGGEWQIIDDRLFFVGAESMFIYEYKIVEK